MIASLMMYQRPQLLGAHNRYWALIRQNLKTAAIGSPEQLSQDAEEFFVWKHPDLVLSQTCGMPYRTWLHDQVALVGTPDYGVTDCPPGYYRSALVVRAEDSRQTAEEFRGAVFAYNESFSQSGYAAPYWHLRPRGVWFENRLHTWQHLASARAVAEGRADIAALDAVTWRLMSQYDAFAAGLRVLEWTAPTPGLPLITARGNDARAIFDAVKQAIAQLGEADRTALGLKGIVKIDAADYLAIKNPEA
jgi:ABC-type phosphate/phosphonate transport system substrate-binding protein